MKRNSKLFFSVLFIQLFIIPISQQTLSPSISENISTNQNLVNNDNNLKTKANSFAEYPEVLRIGDLFQETNFNPLFDYSYIRQIVYDSLVDVDMNSGEIYPRLARQWVVTNDSTEWIFYLRENVFFHDGKHFNATAVKYSFDILFDPNHKNYSPDSWIATDAYIPIESISITNEYEIKIDLKMPYAPLLSKLPFIPIVEPENMNLIFSEEPHSVAPIGTGPYILNISSSILTENNTYLVFNRNNDYFLGIAPFKEIHYQFFSGNEEEYKNAIESKELDIFQTRDSELISNLTISNLISDQPYWNITNVKSAATHDLAWFNFSNPFLNDVNVRRAINYAIDKTAYINELRRGLALPINSIIPKTVEHHDSTVERYPYNLSEARTLLDQAGYTIGVSGYRFSLTVKSPNFIFSEERGQFVCSALESVEIKCDFQSEEWVPSLLNGDFDIYVVGYLHVPDPSIAYDLLNSNGVNNYGKYSDPVLDLLTSYAIKTPVQQEQELIYKVIQVQAQVQCPYILLADLPNPYVKRLDISNIVGFDFYGDLSFTFQTGNYGDLSSKAMKKIVSSFKNNLELQTNDEIVIGSKPMYLPFTDSILAIKNSKILVTVMMSYQSYDFIDNTHEIGKFYSILVDQQTHEYSFRAYYDLDEIGSISSENLGLFKWNSDLNDWSEIPITSSNSSLRYLETSLMGNSIIKLGEIKLIKTGWQTIYILIPMFALIFASISLSIWALIKNKQFLRQLRN